MCPISNYPRCELAQPEERESGGDLAAADDPLLGLEGTAEGCQKAGEDPQPDDLVGNEEEEKKPLEMSDELVSRRSPGSRSRTCKAA